jgi:hypothetical protein
MGHPQVPVQARVQAQMKQKDRESRHLLELEPEPGQMMQKGRNNPHQQRQAVQQGGLQTCSPGLQQKLDLVAPMHIQKHIFNSKHRTPKIHPTPPHLTPTTKNKSNADPIPFQTGP